MVILALIIGIIFAGVAEGSWRVVKIGTCPTTGAEEIEVVKGRNDGKNRVYVVTMGGGIYEWTYSGGNWSYEAIFSGAPRFIPLGVGYGRGDNINRLYIGEWGYGGIKEASFSGSSWTNQYVSNTVGSVLCVRVGDGRDDNIMRLYAGGQYFGLYEYTRTGSTWNLGIIDGAPTIGTLDIGDGRNDGKNRIYAPDRFGPVYEYTWSGSSFNQVVITVPQQNIVGVAVGQGRSDETNRIYASRENGHLYELTYSSGIWQYVDMTPSGPNKSHYGIRVDRMRSDGKYRVYTTTQGGAVTEFSWNGSAWKDSVVDAVSGATACLDIGVGRNDDTFRIYATNYQTGGVYEFTNTSPYGVAEESQNSKFKTQKLEAYPNPFVQRTVIRVQGLGISETQSPIPNLQLLIYDLAGRRIKHWDLEFPDPSRVGTGGNCDFHEVVWDGTDDLANRVKTGIYWCRLEADGRIKGYKKLILIGG
ncbi:MAG: hypothetical protein HY769_01090 [Candidatus Stahlbacteria bacterium]|nr:hypothetical protein [Candidatus Stahlbacteria bacterium]